MSNRIQSFLLLVAAPFCELFASGQSLPNLFPLRNASGFVETYNDSGAPIALTGPFFQSLGTNGRSCASCHRPAAAWGATPEEIRHRFEATHGFDPIFRTNDGSVCDHDIDTSTMQGRRSAYRLLLDRGLFRIALAVPDSAEFTVVSVVNPYGCGDPATLSVLSPCVAGSKPAFPERGHVGRARVIHADGN